MKNKFISLLLVSLLTISMTLPVQAAAVGSGLKYCTIQVETKAASLTAKELSVKERIDGLRSVYPQGMYCTDETFFYIDPATGRNTGNSGCYAFAMYVFDHAFGKGAFYSAKETRLTEATYSQLKMGDHIRIHDLPHSQIVLEVHEDYVVVAEGNFNKAVYWDNVVTKAELLGYDAVSFYSAY